MGDYLIVSVTTDENVNKGPGRPINSLEKRMDLLRELRCVDEVVAANSAIEAIKAVCPAIFVKGIDYADGRSWTEDVERVCASIGCEVRFTTSAKTSAAEIIRKAMA